MNYEAYFPRGIAKGNAFCNRQAEREQLKNNIQICHHTLLISPRRYGKTSLVKYAVEELDILYGETDLFIAVDAKQIEQQILAAIKNIMQTVSTSIEQTIFNVAQFFKKINTKWTVGTQGVEIVLIPDRQAPSPMTIIEALQALEDLLKKKNQRAVLFIDEIQEIGEVAEGKGIEGAIRHVAQEAQHIAFIFSGSKRHLLANMFYDKARPLYKLCDRIRLERISEADYQKHLNALAKKRWGNTFSEEALAAIFNFTECHPFYLNALCLRLWTTDLKKIPTSDVVEQYWNVLVAEERQEIIRELETLSTGQRKILIAIAQGHNTALTGKIFLRKMGLTSSSVSEALKKLELRDYIEKNENGEYHCIDPMFATALRLYFIDETQYQA